MPERIPKSAAKNVVFRAISSTDHFTPKASLGNSTVSITIRKWGGGTSFANPAAGATAATEIASGFYQFSLGTGDTDTDGPLAWRAAASGMDDVGDVYEVVAATNAGFTGLGAEVATAVWTTAVDGAVTAEQSLRLHNSAIGGKASGLATTTAVYRDLADTKDRISATVDADGNRSAVTRTLT